MTRRFFSTDRPPPAVNCRDLLSRLFLALQQVARVENATEADYGKDRVIGPRDCVKVDCRIRDCRRQAPDSFITSDQEALSHGMRAMCAPERPLNA